MKKFKWHFFLLTFYNFLRLPFRSKLLEKNKEKKTSRRHSSKLTQTQNLEKERKLNLLLNIILDLEGLSGASLYFLAG